MIVDRHITAAVIVRADAVAAGSDDVGKVVNGHVTKHRGIRRIGRSALISRENSGGSAARTGKRCARVDSAVSCHRDQTRRHSANLWNGRRLIVGVDPGAAGCDDVVHSGCYGNSSCRVRERFDPVPACTGNSIPARARNAHISGAQGKGLDTVISAQDGPCYVDCYIASVRRIEVFSDNAAGALTVDGMAGPGSDVAGGVDDPRLIGEG